MRSSNSWFYLLMLTPFLNILNIRVGEIASLLLILFYLGAFVFGGKRRKGISKQEKPLYRLIVISFMVVLINMFFSALYSIDNFYYIRFFCLSFMLMPVFFLWGDSFSFIKERLLFVLKYYIIIISLSIVFGAVLKMAGLDHLEPMYDVTKWVYMGRPFGIFGQPSVNSCLLCFFYLFHRSAVKLWHNKYDNGKDWLFFFVTIGVVLQGSGSGFLSYAFVLLSKFLGKGYKIQWSRMLIMGAAILIVLYQIILSGLVPKISIEYIDTLREFVMEELIEPYLKLTGNNSYVLWGIPDFPLSIDLGPLYMMGTIGLVATIYIFLFLFYVAKQTRSIDMKLGIILLVVGNLHYPVMFYMIMHFIWYIIVYYIFVIERLECKDVKVGV